jgi:hypothetical protein
MAIDSSSNPSLNEIVSSLAARVDKQHDVAFMDELKHIVNYKRSKALYVWMMKLPLRDFLYQSFVIDTERVGATDPCAAEFPTDCWVVRTVCRVPEPFRDPRLTLSYEIFDYVGHSSGYMPYAYAQMEYISLLKYKPYTATAKKWFYSDGYIYILNEKTTPVGTDPALTPPIRVRGVFQDPTGEFGCNVCDDAGNVCTPDSGPYPVPPELLAEIIEDTLRVELKVGSVPTEQGEEKDTIKVDTTEKVIHENL